eukprot:3346287-Pyramimonas_sp.AAC.1
MGVPAWAAKLSRNFYAGNAARIHFCGLFLEPLRLGRGVRQGCPASALLLALALGPVCRWPLET